VSQGEHKNLNEFNSIMLFALLTTIFAFFLNEIKERDPIRVREYKDEHPLFDFVVIITFITAYFPNNEDQWIILPIALIFTLYRRFMLKYNYY
tara:strand:- start:291 stop:569 length:279 start_codon:yes stop_codon:yes gene_type:complete